MVAATLPSLIHTVLTMRWMLVLLLSWGEMEEGGHHWCGGWSSSQGACLYHLQGGLTMPAGAELLQACAPPRSDLALNLLVECWGRSQRAPTALMACDKWEA